MGRVENRPIEIFLTHKYARMLRKLCVNEMRKREKQRAKSSFVPEPGKFDSNLVKIRAMQSIIRDIDRELETKEEPVWERK